MLFRARCPDQQWPRPIGNVESAIRILRTAPAAGTASAAGSIALEAGISVQGLYVEGDRLVVLTSEAYFGNYGEFWTALPYWAPNRFGLRIYDIANPGAPRAVFSARLDGTFVDSRRIGDKVYVVSRYAPRLLLDGSSRSTVEAASLSSLLPGITIDGATRPLVDPLRCYVTADNSDSSSATLTSITVFSLSSPASPVTTCYNEDAYGVHVSGQSVYLAQYRNVAGPTVSTATQRTRIHRFELGAAAPLYRGSAEVEGVVWLGGQADFRLSESGGVLRLMTTQYMNDPADNQDHQLYILRQSATRPELETVGRLPNDRRPEEIGKPGESLYGVRFLGNRAFAATFMQVDPLYTFDLANPADPRIAGALSLPGFSDFLHPVSDGLLLGIGQSAVGGVRVALFDVSRLDQPRELGGIDYGASGTSSEARYDRHAFAYLADVGTTDHLAIPFNLYSTDGQYRFIRSVLGLLEIRNKSQPANASLVEIGQLVSRNASGATAQGPVGRSRAFLHPDSVFYVADDDVFGAIWSRPDPVLGPF